MYQALIPPKTWLIHEIAESGFLFVDRVEDIDEEPDVDEVCDTPGDVVGPEGMMD